MDTQLPVPAGRVNVTHEWGRLKEVIVGRADTVRVPDLSKYDRAFLAEKFTARLPLRFHAL